MPDISYEALFGAALIVALALGYQYFPKSADSGSGSGTAKAKKKPSNKKKGKAGARDGGALSAADEAQPTAGSGDVGKGQRKQTASAGGDGVGADPSSSKSKQTAVTAAAQGKRADKPNSPSFASVAAAYATSPDDPEPTPAAKPKTLAEKIAPKPRKTKVDDMLAPEDRPAAHARVMKVVPAGAAGDKSNGAIVQAVSDVDAKSESSTSQAGSSGPDKKVAKYAADYQDEDEDTTTTGTVEDDGWDVVPSRKKKPVSLTLSEKVAQSSTSQPLPVETKIQRKNAKKAEARKEAKADEEEERLKRLAQHRKGLERERINEIYQSQKKGGASGKTNGGAFASLDTNGKLVWD